MRKLIGLLAVTVIANPAQSVDASKHAANIESFGHWQVIQFALSRAIVYRVSSISISDSNATITLDFSEKCTPGQVVMNMNVGTRRRQTDPGLTIFAYKVPGDAENLGDIADAEFSGGFLFFSFKNLTAQQLYVTHGAGNLAIWIPASGDGTVKRSDNVYFSLDQFPVAYDRAKQLCMDNR